MKERWMGLDYGTKTVGVAVSDVLGITAQGVETVTRKSNKKLRQTLARIEALIEEYEVSKIVLGLPKNMNNTLGERAEETKEFQAMLQRRTGLEVVLWDERLTTMESERILQEGGVRLYFFFDKLLKSEITMPSIREQSIIGSLFDWLDSLIALHQRKRRTDVSTEERGFI